MKYTAVIRTLGKAGDKYQTLLDSLKNQTIPPEEIIVYIAEGYELPKETIGTERYVYVPKGMVAQRALRYDEVKTEWMLFLDDDLYLPSDSVERMYDALVSRNADIISPDIFENSHRSMAFRLKLALSAKMCPRMDDGWAYKVMRTTGFSYNRRPSAEICWASTNAGPCLFCTKQTFLSIEFEHEIWLDSLEYALGEDQVMFYKSYLRGYKQLTLFNSGIRHLDAGTSVAPEEREDRLNYSDLWFRIIFWDRFIRNPETKALMKVWNVLCISYLVAFSFASSIAKLRIDTLKIKYKALKDARAFLKSAEYRFLPPVI